MVRRYYENKNIKINTYLMQKLIDFEKDIYSNNSKKKYHNENQTKHDSSIIDVYAKCMVTFVEDRLFAAFLGS